MEGVPSCCFLSICPQLTSRKGAQLKYQIESFVKNVKNKILKEGNVHTCLSARIPNGKHFKEEGIQATKSIFALLMDYKT